MRFGENRHTFDSSAFFVEINLVIFQFDKHHLKPEIRANIARKKKPRTRGFHFSLYTTFVEFENAETALYETFFARFHFDAAEHELSEVELLMILAILTSWRLND